MQRDPRFGADVGERHLQRARLFATFRDRLRGAAEPPLALFGKIGVSARSGASEQPMQTYGDCRIRFRPWCLAL